MTCRGDDSSSSEITDEGKGAFHLWCDSDYPDHPLRQIEQALHLISGDGPDRFPVVNTFLVGRDIGGPSRLIPSTSGIKMP